MALQFANCLLSQAGQQQYPCHEEQDIAVCLEDVDNNAFTAYSNFYTHTQNMCYFIKSQEWQEMQDHTIKKLSSSSARVAEEMEESINLQKEIVVAQRDSLSYQKQLAENGSFLSKAIEASKGNVREMLDEFRISTNEQKNLIFEVFDRVSRLQNLVISEVSWLYTVIFYSACLLIIYLLSATKRTADARMWLFLILSINFGLERLVIGLSLSDEGDLSQTLSNRIWMVRNTAIVISMVVLVVMAIKFKDINLINNTLLEEIKNQNLELKMSMMNFQAGSKDRVVNPRDGLDSLGSYYGHHLSEMIAEDTGFIGDEEEEYTDSDSDSLDYSQADITFHPDTTLSDSRYVSAVVSRETTPTNQCASRNGKVVEALSSSITHSTPFKKKAELIPKLSNQPRYNLRTRGETKALKQDVLQESPESFARMVKEQLCRSRRNHRKWKKAVANQNSGTSD